MKKWFMFLAVFIFLSGLTSAALGISPAIKKYDFVEGKTIVIDYKILGDSPGREINLVLGGDLAKFAELSKTKLEGLGGFTVTINLPISFDVPGEHLLSVGAKEVPPENEFLGTAIDIRATVKVFVPYPGKYLDVNLNIPDGNVDEKIPVEVNIINRGKESTNLKVKVLFFDSLNKLVDTMSFNDVFLNVSEDRYFRKFFDSSGYKPGNYLAKAVVNYGEEKSANRTFRIGSLFVNISNFTESLPKKGIQKFLINVESKWNGNLKDVYADVNLSNGLDSVKFRTPSIDLEAWKSGVLEGFLDTDKLEGKYDVNIILNYAGQQSFASGFLSIRKFSYALIILVASLVLLLGIIFVIWKIKRKSKNKK